MKVNKRIFSAFICLAIICLDAFAAPSSKCRNREYAARHPDECPKSEFFSISSATTIGGVALIGGAAVALGTLASSSSSASDTASTHVPAPDIPTLQTYNMVGGDVSAATLAGIWTRPDYIENQIKYDDIRLAYSLARGFTGTGTNIAILDAAGKHGETVSEIAGGTIAPNANVNFYQVTDNNGKFLSYREIGDVIASAQDANVFNASWSVKMRASDIYSREQLAAATDSHFINQITTTATTQDAIFVFAAGNNGYRDDSSALSAMPLVIPELNGHFINVVAWDSDAGELAFYSNACGPTMNYCITAPGTDIHTNTTAHATGTSFAAPIVSAAIAVIREAFPYMTASQVSSLLFETARDLGTPGVDETYGHGMLDLERATRPVGTALVPVASGANIPLRTAHVSGAVAKNIKDADLELAFIDAYGRAFTTRLNDNISIRNPGRAFARLRGGDNQSFSIGNIEMGFSNTDLIFGDGMLATDTNKNLIGFVGAKHDFNIGNININTHARVGRTNPQTDENSMIESFRDITVANIGMTANMGDWTFGFGIPDTIIGGKMNLRMPMGRADNGEIIYGNAQIDMATTPSYEYNIGYKFMSAGFIDNPYGTDELYFMARGKFSF